MEFNKLGDIKKRKELTKLYLSGETTLAEERKLAHWYKHNGAEEDERHIANLLSALSLPTVGQENVLSDEGVQLFDELVNEKIKHKQHIWKVLTAVISAAAIAAAFVFGPKNNAGSTSIQPSAEEIIESVLMLSEISLNEISYMTTEPLGQDVILTVQLENEDELSFLISKNKVDGSIRLLALLN